MALRINPDQAGLRFNKNAGRYVGPDGRFLSPFKIREVIDADLNAADSRLMALIDRMEAREISLEVARALFAKEVKAVHINNYGAASGGFTQLKEADFGRIGAIVKKQYKFLDRFFGVLEQNPALIGTQMMRRRASSYITAGRVTYEAERQRREVALGALWARRILHSRESCPGCLEIAGIWFPVEEMPPIGTLQCNIWCACTIDYAYGVEQPEEDAPTPSPPRSGARKVRPLED